MCRRQPAVDDESNEIPAVQELLKLMEIEGATVTLDAMHRQVETALAIVAGGAEYVLTVKGNRETLHQELNDEFIAYGEADYRVPGLRKQVTVERSHGRNERREYYFIEAPRRLKSLKRWRGLKSIGMVYRRREIEEKIEEETTFFITSREPKVREPSRFIRDHWGIENREHWILDATFAEDSSRIRKDSSPEISGVFRRLALNILQRDTSIRENIRGKRLRAGWDEKVLDAIYAGVSSV